ncbi:MAG: hypothetical protein WA956_14430 [Stenotrophomonas sp.]
MKPARFRGWRLLAVATLTWFFGSLLFAPMLNPWVAWRIRTDGPTFMLLQQANIDMMMVREELHSHWLIHDQWPRQAKLPGVHDPADALLDIDVPALHEVRFRYTSRFPAASRLRGTELVQHFDPQTQSWSCRPGTPSPPSRLLGHDCRGSVPWTIIEWLTLVLVMALLALAGIAALWFFVRPAVAAVIREPCNLFRHPITTLPRLDRQLGWLRARSAVLEAAGVPQERWRQALHYLREGADARATRLATCIGADSMATDDWALPGQVHLWRLPVTLPVALERLWLYLPPPELPAERIIALLRGLPSGQDVVLVVSPVIEADTALLDFSRDPANLCVCLGQAAQTAWLLKSPATRELVTQLARQLQVTRISPYQTRGGVTRPAAFFGRDALLARVLNREPGNYLLVGGRQLGKTSLMKAIERRFDGHPRVHCRYLSLRDHRLGARLAAELALPADTELDALVEALAARAGGRRLLLLVDETDLFMRAEAENGYQQLSALRALSESGRCHFMLAGFWDLYEAAMHDYASPIRNFGEVIHLGGLEREACIALAVEPMARLGIHFNDGALPASLVAACGQRANLVAIVCQQALENLDRGQRLIDQHQTQTAMQSEAVLDALAGWARLSPDPVACRIDRIVVYRAAQAHMARTPAFSLPGLLQDFDRAGIGIEAEALRRSLSRLQLAYVLKRDGSGEQLHFAVPLFAMQFQPGEVDALLERELHSMRGECNG